MMYETIINLLVTPIMDILSYLYNSTQSYLACYIGFIYKIRLVFNY